MSSIHMFFIFITNCLVFELYFLFETFSSQTFDKYAVLKSYCFKDDFITQ